MRVPEFYTAVHPLFCCIHGSLELANLGSVLLNHSAEHLLGDWRPVCLQAGLGMGRMKGALTYRTRGRAFCFRVQPDPKRIGTDVNVLSLGYANIVVRKYDHSHLPVIESAPAHE